MLRVPGERPGEQSAPDKGDELAVFHMEFSARTAGVYPTRWDCKQMLRRPRGRVEQLADVAGEDRLAVRPERAQLLDEIAHRRTFADFLRVIGGEYNASGRNLYQRA